MFKRFADLRNSKVDVTGVDIDKIFNELVSYINKLDTRLNIVLKNSEIEISKDGFIKMNNNALNVETKFVLDKPVDISRMQFVDKKGKEIVNTSGLIVSDDSNPNIHISSYDKDEFYFVYSDGNNIKYEKNIINFNSTFYLKTSNLSKNIINHNNIDYVDLKKTLLEMCDKKLAIGKFSDNRPVKVEKADLYYLSDEQKEILKNTKVPDSAFPENFIDFSTSAVNPYVIEHEVAYGKITEDVYMELFESYYEGRRLKLFDCFEINFINKINSRPIEVATAVVTTSNMLRVRPDYYFYYSYITLPNGNVVNCPTSTIHLNSENIGRENVQVCRYQVRALEDEQGNPLDTIVFDLGLIKKNKLSEKLRVRLGLDAD